MTTVDYVGLPRYQPTYAHPGDAAADLYSREYALIYPRQRRLIPTGVKIQLPEGAAGLILPRSGNAVKKGLTVLNTPGLIDSGYRGEIQVLLHNTGENTVEIQEGDRIAQLLAIPYLHVEFRSVRELEDTPRGEGGFGSTGSVV